MSDCGCKKQMVAGNIEIDAPNESFSLPMGCPQGCAPASQCCGGTVPTLMQQGNCHSMCPEDNRQYVYVTKVSQTYKLRNSIAVPACNASIRAVFENVTDVAIGAYMWAAGIGFLEIIGYNSSTNEIELRNNCPSGVNQAAPGTPIPACTIFVLTVPYVPGAGTGGQTTLYPYLGLSFTAPANGDCLLITVTNVNGLAVGKNIAISTGVYRIQTINSATSITICNDGSGLPVGTVVNAQDANSNYIVPLVLIDANPCTNPTVLSGQPLVCAGSVEAPLVGQANDQFLVYNSTTGQASFQSVGVPLATCQPLSVCLTLDGTNPPGTQYVITVPSNVEFFNNDVVVIDGYEFTVRLPGPPDSTHIWLTPITSFSGIITIPAGAPVCLIDCCSILNARITNVPLLMFKADAIAISAGQNVAANAVLGGNQAQLTIANTYNTSMDIHMFFNWFHQFDVTGTSGTSSQVDCVSEYLTSMVAMPTPVPVYHNYKYESAITAVTRKLGAPASESDISLALAPGGTLYIAALARLDHALGGTATITANQLSCRVTAIAKPRWT